MSNDVSVLIAGFAGLMVGISIGVNLANRQKKEALPRLPDIAPGRLMHISRLPAGRYQRRDDPRLTIVVPLQDTTAESGKAETAVWSDEIIHDKFIVRNNGRIRILERRLSPVQEEE